MKKWKIKAKTHADEKRKQKFNETTNARRVYHFISICLDSGDDAQTHVQLALEWRQANERANKNTKNQQQRHSRLIFIRVAFSCCET